MPGIWNSCRRSWSPDTGVAMKFLTIFFFCMLSVSTAWPAPAAPPRMRPYSGVGILMFPAAGDTPLPLYEEPGLSRLGTLNTAKIPRYEWIFGAFSTAAPLIVTKRKGSWLRVAYDDAGREAWMNPARAAVFQAWEVYLKDHVSRLLPGLQKKYYQLYQQPGQSALAPLTTRQILKVLRLENDWAMVLVDQNSLGWLRWRDEDGRLLIGVASMSQGKQL